MSEELQTELAQLQADSTALQAACAVMLEENARLKSENAILVARCTRLQKSFEAQHRMHEDAAAKLEQHLSGKVPEPEPT